MLFDGILGEWGRNCDRESDKFDSFKQELADRYVVKPASICHVTVYYGKIDR